MKKVLSGLALAALVLGAVVFRFAQTAPGNSESSQQDGLDWGVAEGSEDADPVMRVTKISPPGPMGEVNIVFDLPFLGKLAFKAKRDELSSKIIVNYPGKDDVKIDWGIFSLDSGTFVIPSEGPVSYLGKGKFFGHKVTVGLKKLEFISLDEFNAMVEELSQKAAESYVNAKKEWQDKLFGGSFAMELESLKRKLPAAKPIKKEEGLPDAFKVPGFFFDFKLIKKIVFGFTFDEKPEKLELIPGLKVTVKSIDLVLDRLDIPKLKFKTVLWDYPITFSVFVDKVERDFGAMASFKKWRVDTVVPMLKDSPVGSFSAQGNIRISKQMGVSVFGKLTSEDGLQNAFLEIIPGVSISLDEIKASVTPDRKVSINTTGSFQGKPILFAGEMDPSKKYLTLSTEVKGYQFGDLIPELKNSELNKLIFSGSLNLIIADKKTIVPALSGSNWYSSTVGGSGIRLEGSVESASGEKFDLFGIEFKGKGQVKLDTLGKAAQVSGTVESLGLKLEGMLSIKWGTNSEVQFSTALGQGVREWKPFEQLVGKDETLKPLRDITIYDLKVGTELGFSRVVAKMPAKVNLVVQKTPADLAKEKAIADTLAAKAAQAQKAGMPAEKEKELEEIPLQIIKPESLNKVTEKFSGAIFVNGKAKVFGVVCDVMAKVSKQTGQDFGVMLIVSMPNGWKISQSFPELFKDKNLVTDAIDSMKISNIKLILSTYKDTSMRVEPGVNLEAAVSLTGPVENMILKGLQDILSKTGNRGAGGVIIGQIDPLNPRTASLKMGLTAGDFTISIPPFAFKAATLYLLVRGEPKIALAGSLEMIPMPNIPPLQWSLEAGLTPTGVGFDISMLGTWPDPFQVSKLGIKNFELGDLGFKWYMPYSSIAAAAETFGTSLLIPDILGLSGKVALGSPDPVKAAVAFGFGVDVTNCFIDLKVENAITAGKFADTVRSMLGIPPLPDILTWKMGALIMDEVFLRLVPSETTIGDIKFKKGIGGGAKLRMFGKTVDFGLSIDTWGIEAKGTMDPLEFGPFALTSFDGKGGPIVEFTVHFEKGISIQLDGLLKLGDIINSKTIAVISEKRGLIFETETSIGPKEAEINAHITGVDLSLGDPLKLLQKLNPKNLALTIEFTNTFTDKLNKTIGATLERQKQTFKKDINDIIVQLRSTTKVDQIRALERQLHQAEARRVPFIENPVLSVEREAEVTKAQLALDAARAKYALEQTDIGKIAGKTLQDLGLPQVAQEALKNLQQLGVVAYESGQFAFKNLSNLVVVRSVYWKGTAADLAGGVLPGVMVKMVVLGNEVEQNLGEFDVRNPVESAQRIVGNLATLGQNKFKDTLKKGVSAAKK